MAGRVITKLAALLQKSFPTSSAGLALTWSPKNIYPATGAYRTSGIDCARWEATATHVRPDGTMYSVCVVSSYSTMTELIRFPWLDTSPDTGEIGGSMTDPSDVEHNTSQEQP